MKGGKQVHPYQIRQERNNDAPFSYMNNVTQRIRHNQSVMEKRGFTLVTPKPPVTTTKTFHLNTKQALQLTSIPPGHNRF